jgi:hypothetical protein
MQNFLTGDDFGVLSMTSAINTLPVVPARVGSLGLFKGGGITTTSVGVESMDGVLKLIPTQPRGTMPEYKRHEKAILRAIPVPHLPKNDVVLAESLQGVRQFGTDSTIEGSASVINTRLAALKAEHELTWEYHRVGALQGLIKDADGSSTVVNLFTEFNVSRITINWDMTEAYGLKAACIALRRTIETELNLMPYERIHVFVGEEFWDKLMTSTETNAAFNRYRESEFARNSNNDVFEYSKVMFEEMRGKVGNIPLIPVAEGAAFPIVQNGLYEQVFAPGTFLEAVGTVGLPYYAKQEAMKFNTGVELHTQSNPLFIVKKPRVLVKLTFSE